MLQSIDVTQYIKDDVTRIAAASTSSPGDNTNVLRLIDLQNKATTNNATFSDYPARFRIEPGY